MVATPRLATGLTGLRNRNTRVTNKTLLRVVKGNIEADPIILDDEDDEKHRVLASQGVDEDDANEHHLQAALFASSQRSQAQYKPETTATDSNAFIPTPDATGVVAEYDDLYPSKRYKDPATHLRFSDSLDESYIGGLAGSFTYFLDERDAEWLANHNSSVKGEGSSTIVNGTIPSSANNTTNLARNTTRPPQGRNTKTKGKEPEHSLPKFAQQSSLTIDEDQFELIMGLLEKWTDEQVSPYLHLTADPEHFPDFNNYHNLLATTLPPSTFANFQTPANLPTPEKMVQLGKVIYPWWKERRMEGQGHRIVPQLNVLVLDAQEKEDRTGGSPYTCFRKRDVKPMRRTRTNTVTHTEKLARLRLELQSSLELTQMVLQREKLKRDSVNAGVDVWRSRETLAEYIKQINTTAPGSLPPADDLLYDKERRPKKPKIETTGSGRIILAANRRPSHVRNVLSDPLDPHSPLSLNGDTSHAFEECQKWPSARAAGIQREVEKELAKARKDDVFWEDLVDMPYQSIAAPPTDKFYKPSTLLENDMSFVSPFHSSTTREGEDNPAPASTSRIGRSLRLRTGRGGRLHLDRHLHTPKIHLLLRREQASHPPRLEELAEKHRHTERWSSRDWHPRESSFRNTNKDHDWGYLSHPSIYDGEHSDDIRMRDIDDDESQDPTFGIEQSLSGWDARELWARAKAMREEGGRKVTHHMVVDHETVGMEVATRNAERERDREIGYQKPAGPSRGGAALAPYTDNSLMDIDHLAEEGQHDDVTSRTDSGRTIEAQERAWRIDERWRYDSDGNGTQGFESDDRFLLDDYQAKFLRTSVTLLEAQDHETIKTDPALLTPVPPKHNRYLDYQLRLQHPGVPQLSSSSPVVSLHPMPLRIPLPSNPVLSPSPATNGSGDKPQTLSLEPATPQTASSNASTNGNAVLSATANGTPSRPIPTSPKLHCTAVPTGAQVPQDYGSTLRLNTPVRTNQTLNGHTLSHPPTPHVNGTTNPYGNSTNGVFPVPPSKGYPIHKTTFDRVIPAQLEGSTRLYPISHSPNGVTVNEQRPPLNMSLGVGNLHLKLPTARSAQPASRPNGENQPLSMSTDNAASGRALDPFAMTHPQHLSHPRLSSTGTRAS